MRKLRSYHFSVGNSSVGPVGYCARILATSEKKAIERLLQLLPVYSDVQPTDELFGEEYIQAYFNDAQGVVTSEDIEDVDDIELYSITADERKRLLNLPKEGA